VAAAELTPQEQARLARMWNRPIQLQNWLRSEAEKNGKDLNELAAATSRVILTYQTAAMWHKSGGTAERPPTEEETKEILERVSKLADWILHTLREGGERDEDILGACALIDEGYALSALALRHGQSPESP
jgi:hypothetical protein